MICYLTKGILLLYNFGYRCENEENVERSSMLQSTDKRGISTAERNSQ